MILEKTNLAPIVLFGYNRPKHIKITLEALSKNELAANTELFIFIDGHKHESDKGLNEEVIEVCKGFNWPGISKIINVRNRNYGLADNIITGVTEIVNKKGRVIVVEDDIETSKGFLKYMNEALCFYENNPQVMHIAGYMFPITLKRTSETFFYQATSCWGWATWHNRWQHLNQNSTDLLKMLDKKGLLKWFDLDNSGVFLNQLKRNVSGEISTWAIKWQASVNLMNGLSLHPTKSLVRNIGFDNSGQNCGESELYSKQKLSDHIRVKEIPIKLDENIRNKMKKFYSNTNIIQRGKNKVHSVLNRLRSNPKPRWHQIRQGPAKGKFIFVAQKAFNGWTDMINGSFDGFWYNKLQNENLNPKIILDIGSHFGYHSIALKSFYPQAEIICFEPNPFNIERLRINLAKNKLNDIKIQEIAVSDTCGITEFTLSSNIESSQSTGSFLSNVIPPLDKHHYSTFHKMQVKTETLDSICVRMNIIPGLIKMDIEGAELNAIIGGINTIQKYKPVLCIEAHSKTLFAEIEKQLSDIYNISVLENEGVRSFMYCKPV